jgi:hypothetical protein
VGQKPKWCSQRCADLGKKGGSYRCQRCGVSYFGLGPQYCSRECSGIAVPNGTPSVIAEAHAKGDWHTVLRLVREVADIGESGCWLWPSLDRQGYPRIKGRQLTAFVHRIVLEAKCQAPLGSQSAHHACGVPACVNPEHLQPVTHAANVAEMLARGAYQRRVRELEAALTAVAPDHPLLSMIPTA